MKLLGDFEKQKKGFNSDISRIKKGVSKGQKSVGGVFHEFSSLPWNKLPIQGWLSLGVIIVIFVLLIFFVIPGINNF